MIPATQDRQVTSQGLKENRAFGISRRNESFIKMILRDKIYRDKVLAVLREYSSNAWDAHRMPGGPGADVPIHVTLPTNLEPTLVIRDFGPGISPDDIMTVFTQYGESTKRDTNEATGMLGLGCKSGFAYGDQFGVVSWHGGVKRVYSAVLTDTDDDFALMSETPCGDETGIEIKIPVRVEDVYLFEQRARELFPYFEPRPVINTDLPSRVGTTRTHGWIDEQAAMMDRDPSDGYGHRTRGGHWIAVMGCVPYRVDLAQIKAELEHEGLWDTLQNMSGGLKFGIGQVSFTVSREELEYTDETKTALVARFRGLVDEYTTEILATLESSTMSPWDKRLKARFMRAVLRLPIPSRYSEWGKEKIAFSKEVPAPPDTKDEQGNLLKTVSVKPQAFRLSQKTHEGMKAADQVRVSVTTKLYMQDTDRTLTGHDLHTDHLVVSPTRGHNLDAARKELATWCEDLGITGITTENLSSLPWTPKHTGKQPNKKHNVRTFKLSEHASSHRTPLSTNWSIVDREPTDEDVFVVIAHFKVNDGTNFYSTVEGDRRLAKAFGLPFPEIYGYKTTEKKPVTAAECKGTEYHEWRKTYFRKHVNSTLFAQLAAYHWASVLPDRYESWYEGNDYRNRQQGSLDKLLAACREKLGDKHPITDLVSRHRQGRKDLAKMDRSRQESIGALAEIVEGRRRSSAKVALDKVMAMYPLIEGSEKDLTVLVGRKGQMWIDYIKMADKAAGRAF